MRHSRHLPLVVIALTAEIVDVFAKAASDIRTPGAMAGARRVPAQAAAVIC